MELTEHLARMKRILNEVIYSKEKENLKKIAKAFLNKKKLRIKFTNIPNGMKGEVYSKYPHEHRHESEFLFSIEGKNERNVRDILDNLIKQAKEEYANYTNTDNEFKIKTFYFQVPDYDEPLAIEARSFEKAIEELEIVYGKGFLWRVKLLKPKDVELKTN